jgi:hypothetical protein
VDEKVLPHPDEDAPATSTRATRSSSFGSSFARCGEGGQLDAGEARGRAASVSS